MVQLYYYENLGAECRKLLAKTDYPVKVVLFPYEGWAASALRVTWTLKLHKWSRSRCKVVELKCGSRMASTVAKVTEFAKGYMSIRGRFKGAKDPDFELCLTSHVSNADFRDGYLLTGTLERGDRAEGRMELTHFAMVRRDPY
ncbi:Hypp7806 [Branchiostoma lanceolatum]|uniref:Hypp7806 protein n=1 Tax=Branchiostoma lanceolatum TaxID=7740 RepID=A0A8K0EFX5_BRALA|nr:Hypp7806 [Branchiostoma lanceolatum]